MEEHIEIWKDIPEYEGLYQVSNLGKVKSLYFGKEKILKPSKNKDGYLHVNLWKNGKPKSFTSHKIVALAFIPNIQNLPQINHKNEIKTDNRVENLEWVSPKENCNYGTIKERKSEKMKGVNNPMYGKKRTAKTKKKIGESLKKPILQFTKDMVFIREFDSAKSASEELNINSSNIAQCCKNRYKTAGGYVWKYKEI